MSQEKKYILYSVDLKIGSTNTNVSRLSVQKTTF